MVFFFGVLAICLVLAYFATRIEKSGAHGKSSFVFIFLIIIVLSIISGWRYFVGTDFSNYYRFYETLSNDPEYFWKSRFEIGFKSLAFLLSVFTKDPQILFIVCAIITNLLIILSLWKLFTKFFIWAIIAYVCIMYTNGMNILRQWLAFSIVMMSLVWLVRDGKELKYIIGVGIATLFHISSILFFIFYLCVSKMRLIYKILISLVLMVGFIYFDVMNSFFDTYFYLLTDRTNNLTLIIVPAVFLLILLFEVFFRKRNINAPETSERIKEEQSLKKTDYIGRISIIGCLCILLLRISATVGNIYFARLSDMFAFSYVGIIQYIYPKIDMHKKLLYGIIFLIFFLFWFYQSLNNNNNGIFPYINVLLNIRIEQ